jgi:hypothetical protein
MKNNQKGFVNIILIIILVVLASTLLYFVSTKGNRRPIPVSNPNPIPSPSPVPNPKPIPKPTAIPFPNPFQSGERIVRKVGEQEGSFLIQKINQSSVGGLWFQAFPVATNVGALKIIIIGDDIGYACEGVSEKLSSIDFSGQSVTFTKIVRKPPFGGCPI